MGNLSPENQKQLMLQRKKQAYLLKKEAKKERKRKTIKILIFIVVFLLVFLVYENGWSIKFKGFNFEGIKINWFQKKDDKKNTEKQSKGDYKSKLEKKMIAYVPMDDRSIHTSRMEYLAQSAGFELKTPDVKYFKTYLDSGENSYAGYSTKYGNPGKVATWLIELEDEGCDYYILSLDQLLSGGLVGSQYLSDEDFESYEKGLDVSKKVIEKILQDKKNHVYLIDSVVGLSVTPNFMDFTKEDYQLLTTFSSVNRKELAGDELTIDEIRLGYLNDADGKAIATTLSEDKLTKYLDARKRKLTYSDMILSMIQKSGNTDNIQIYYGIDDSGKEDANIQKNDILFIKKDASERGVSITMRDGALTLGEVAFADMLTDAVSSKLKANVVYYGDSTRVVSGTKSTYEEYMNELLSDLDVKKASKDYDFEILVYNSSIDVAKNDENVKKLINRYLKNIKKKIPTVIVNDATLSSDQILVDYLIDYDRTSIPMGYLVGYSNWNGYINSSRIGVTEGITRMLYLLGKKEKSDTCDKGYLRTMGFSYIEDMAYQLAGETVPDIRELEVLMDKNEKKISQNLEESNYISNLSPYTEKGIKNVSGYSYSFPWNRINDIDFEVSVAITDKHGITLPEKIVVKEEKKEG